MLGNYVEAVDNFTRSCSLEPTEDAYCNSANVLALHLKNPLEAAKLLELASDLSPRDGEIRFNRGVILESIGKLEDAISEYEKAADFGIEKAADHLRNCSVKLIQEKFKIQEQEKKV